MTLGRRLFWSLLPLALASMVMAAALAGAGWAAARQLEASHAANERLRAAYEVSQRLLMARAALERGDRALASALLDGARMDGAERLPECLPGLEAAARAVDTASVNAALNRLGGIAGAAQSDSARLAASARAAGDRLLWLAPAAALAVALGALAVGLALRARVAGPVRRIGRGVHRLAEGRLDERLPAGDGDDELARLAGDVNHMAGELQAMRDQLEDRVRRLAAELAQAERLASTGFLAAGVAHEINNPLAVVALEAELLGRRADLPADMRASLRVIGEEAARCKTITRQLLATARGGGEPAQRVALDLRTAAQAAADIAGRFEQAAGRRIEVAGAAIPLHADPAAVRQVLLTLLANALEATPADGPPVRLEVGAAAGWAQARVRDGGRGMGAEEAARCFEPFWTSKRDPAHPGLGLGLSLASAVMAAAGGRLRLESTSPGAGSAFVAEWPPDPVKETPDAG